MNWNDKIQVFNEDCMVTMARYEDNYFDLAVVDPPYGLSIEKSGTHFKKRYKSKGWDKATPTEEYFKELFRVSKNQIIWGGNYFFDKIGNCKTFIIWDKKIGEDMSFAMCEMAWTSFCNGAKIYRKTANQSDRIHPTQKPITLYQWTYQNYAKEGFKILDTHFGSGSNGIAIDSVNKIEKLNLSLVASEIDKDYYLSAKKRFEEKTAWSSLFV